jgi:hypothetical protein
MKRWEHIAALGPHILSVVLRILRKSREGIERTSVGSFQVRDFKDLLDCRTVLGLVLLTPNKRVEKGRPRLKPTPPADVGRNNRGDRDLAGRG